MKPASAPEYDRFKTIIAIILAAILLLMLLRGCATNVASSISAEVSASPNATAIPPTSPIPTQTTLAISPTETLAASPSPTTEPTSTPTTVSSTETPAPALTEASTATPEQRAPTQGQNASCNTSVPSRLSVGQKARVLQRLNMRNEASIDAALIQTNPTNTQVEIIGGPVCTPVGDRAYQWWQIRLPDGKEGWSAESQLNTLSYFLEPIP